MLDQLGCVTLTLYCADAGGYFSGCLARLRGERSEIRRLSGVHASAWTFDLGRMRHLADRTLRGCGRHKLQSLASTLYPTQINRSYISVCSDESLSLELSVVVLPHACCSVDVFQRIARLSCRRPDSSELLSWRLSVTHLAKTLACPPRRDVSVLRIRVKRLAL